MRMNMIEFRSGRKVVKSVLSVDEAHNIARRLVEAREHKPRSYDWDEQES